MRKLFLTMAATFVLASPAAAATAYSNNFDAENGGLSQLNYNGFNGLTVTDGTVDLVRSGDFGITCAGGSGSCVDLDGSTNNSGLTSSGSYAFNAGDRVALTFQFSGNQRGGADDAFNAIFHFGGAIVSGTSGIESDLYGDQDFGPFNSLFASVVVGNIAPNQAFSTLTLYFIPDVAGSASFRFQDFNNDNVGIVIDNVSLDIGPNIGGAVPEPSTWAMLILGFGVIGSAARRRRLAARTAVA